MRLAFQRLGNPYIGHLIFIHYIVRMQTCESVHARQMACAAFRTNKSSRQRAWANAGK